MLTPTRWYFAPQIGISRLIVLCALAFTALFNQAFFHNVIAIYGNSLHGWAFVLSLAVFLFSITVVLLSVLCFRFVTKPLLMFLCVSAAGASYFMNRYNVVIDTTMLTNVFATDSKEVKDLLSPALALQFVILGVVPALLIYRTRILCSRFSLEIRNRVGLIAGALTLAVVSMLPFTADYASFFREHKILRYYANPVTFVYSSIKLVSSAYARGGETTKTSIGLDAHIPATDTDRELIVLVVGEAARADHFSLNGYSRDTNPLLKQENIINFPNVMSCGTATAYSVPCMFSLSNREDFSLEEANAHENLLDVLQHAGVSVLWRDNNSDSKGVADNVEYQDFQTSPTNPICDIECRDVGMLEGLDAWIEAHPTGDLTIVLHQMGNHGPAYSKRYPREFAKFQPECTSSELATCTPAEINNSYDNAILYTDYFLAQTIKFLKGHDDHFETALMYVADHGESLGENGLYLHGLPYVLAPDTQKHVAALMWFGDNYPIDRQRVMQKASQPASHDEYFHTVLGLMEIQTPEYDGSRDWLADAHLPE